MKALEIWTALVIAGAQAVPAFAGESWSVSGSTGTLFYEYEFDVPAARGRYQPHVLLRYGGTFGAPAGNGSGWAMPALPTIRYDHVNVEDPPNGDFQQVHWYADYRNPDNILLPSPRDGADHFNAHVEDAYGDFWQQDAGTWCARDASGNVFRFEARNGSSWSLTQVVDPDGNVTKYSYDVYTRPLSIQYNVFGDSQPSPPPPSQCPAVTLPGGAGFATEIAIEYQTATGFPTNIRVKNACPVSATCPDGVVTVRRYAFGYEQKNVSWYLNQYPWRVDYTLDLLQSITEYGGESGVARPPTTFEYAQMGNDQDPAVKGAHLTKVTTPLGAERLFIWADASQFGVLEDHSYPVVRSVTTTGPGLAAQYTEYGYAGGDGLPTYYYVQTYRPKEYRGFLESWETDSTTGIVKHSWWEKASHAFVGTEARIEYGSRLQADSFPTWTSYTPPTYSLFRTEQFENVVRPITAIAATPTCSPTQTIAGEPGSFASEVVSTMYPVIGFRSKTQTIQNVDSVLLSSQRSVACADVDAWGNVRKASVDPDVTYAGDDYVENASFEVGFNAAATCKDCIRERTKTDPRKSAPNDRLEATFFSYGPTYQVLETYRQAAAVLNPTGKLGTSSYPSVSRSAFNVDGTLQWRTEGAVNTNYTYDAFRLRPQTVLVADANSPPGCPMDGGTFCLVTTTSYDDFGRPSSVTGPAVSGRTDPVPTRYFAYDALGRTRSISQQPISGSVVQAAVQAFDYAEFSGTTPASTTTYDFAVPKNYSNPVPTTGDVRLTVSWVDGLGREIQVRQRMGDPASGGTDPAAGITQNLSQYRVAKAIRYDGAGRVTASVQPYYSAIGTYADLTNASAIDAIMTPAQSVLADLTSYDSQGRVSCTVTRSAVSGGTASIPPVGTCTSSFAEDANYARATLTTYRGVTAGGKSYLAVKALPPENNYSGGPMVGSESFSDAAGLLGWTTDAEGNTTRFAYDLIGRQTKTTREMAATSGGSLSPSTRPTTVDTTLMLDLMGRTVQRTDLNMGRRTFVFDDAVSATLPVTIRFDKTGEEIRYTYDKGRIKETKLCTKTGGVLGCTVDSTLYYDTPYTTSSSYAYTAGRVSWATNSTTTIAFGYDQTGSIVRRDQWFAGITAGAFGSADTPRLDGQSVASGVTTPYGNSSYALSYDSAARPVLLSNGTVGYWAATGSASTGAYDALGQLGSAVLDGTVVNQAWIYRVNETWTYKPASALLWSHRVQFGTAGADVYRVENLRYRGTKLDSFVDVLSSTTYGYWYSHVGRLVAAKATPGGSSQLAQNSIVCVTYNATKTNLPGPSLGNIEQTREGVSSPPIRDYSYSGTNVETGTVSPHRGGPDAPTSAGTTALGYDDYGRIVSTGAGAETFGYDLLGRMTSITRQGGTSEKLAYDPFGALVQRQVGSTVYSYVGKRATVTGTLVAGCQTAPCEVVVSAVDVHVTLGTRRIASVRVYPTSAPRTLYYYRDRLGSVVATTLGGGRAGASYRYSAYGVLEVAVGESSDSASEIGYTGALKLSGGLLSIGARVYNPALKIWMQPDPLEPFKYDYAGGDPVNRIDPTGTEDVAMPATPSVGEFEQFESYLAQIRPDEFMESIEVVAPRRSLSNSAVGGQAIDNFMHGRPGGGAARNERTGSFGSRFAVSFAYRWKTTNRVMVFTPLAQVARYGIAITAAQALNPIKPLAAARFVGAAVVQDFAAVTAGGEATIGALELGALGEAAKGVGGIALRIGFALEVGITIGSGLGAAWDAI